MFSILVVLPKHNVSRSLLFGVFLSDYPTNLEIARFKAAYGVNPDMVMVFIDWGRFIDEKVIKAVYGNNSTLLVTWEPWDATTKKGINFNGMLSGQYDSYISDFALKIKEIDKPVFIRFAHEQNGDWYPWSGKAIGSSSYIGIYRRVKDIFDENKVTNVRWIFSINWEDIPGDSSFLKYYPGDEYVDYIGIDGYNWGLSQSWSSWMGPKDIFSQRYIEVVKNLCKPVLITEFGSSSEGGDRAKWIIEFFKEVNSMDKVYGVVLFNVDKEADWKFKEGAYDTTVLMQELRKHSLR